MESMLLLTARNIEFINEVMFMIKIDGSHGEGGGQILRSAVALSCLLGQEIRVINIRKRRNKPGLKMQHLHGIELAMRMCNAEVVGAALGSTELRFSPGKIRGGKYSVDIGTAGSITLVLQVALPIAIASKEAVTFDIRGGTDVPYSPPVDYYLHVLFPILNMFGAKITGQVLERGYYPEGGGRARIKVMPGQLNDLNIEKRGNIIEKSAYVNMRGLPNEVLERLLRELSGFKTELDVKEKSISRGCGITLVSTFESTKMAGSFLCRRGLRAEKVAKNALKLLDEELNSVGTVDRHMADHLPVYAFVGGRTSFVPSSITSHTRTVLWLVEKFGAKITKEGNKIEVHAYM